MTLEQQSFVWNVAPKAALTCSYTVLCMSFQEDSTLTSDLWPLTLM